ncbi:MAG: DHA2 family efflux MFS transporter permease subunit [Acidimicrobiales bacterium]
MSQTHLAPLPGRYRRPGHSNAYVVLIIVLAAAFMQLVDVSIVNTAIPSIQANLHTSYAGVQLVVVGYTLAFACMLITAARLGDLFGRRRLFMIGMAGFTVASALCASAPNSTILIISRVLQGAMSGIMFPQVLSVIQVTFEPRERGKAFAIYGATVGLATILGPLLGGVLISWNPFGLSWRSIFYVNIPVGIVAFIAARRALGESTAPNPKRLDLKGAVLVSSGLFLLVYPLTEGRDQGWPPWVWVMLGASLLVLGGFTLYELRRSRADRSPLVHMSLFSDRAFVAGGALSMVFFMGLSPFFFTFSIFLQVGLGYSALHTGLTVFPFAVGSGLASAASDRLAKKLGNALLSLGCLVLIAGIVGLMFTVHAGGGGLTSWQTVPSLFVSGLGLGMFIAPVATIILAGIHSEAAGSASGVISTVQQVGGSIGVAIIGVVFFGLLSANAGHAARSVAPQLEASIATAAPSLASFPVTLHKSVTAFDRCFVERSKATDPQIIPPGCPSTPTRGHSVTPLQVAFAGPAKIARVDNFTRSFQETLFYEVAVYLVAFALVFFLPKVDPASAHLPPSEDAVA